MVLFILLVIVGCDCN
nr:MULTISPECIES: YjcZ family sporulation protein [Brevibacillus]